MHKTLQERQRVAEEAAATAAAAAAARAARAHHVPNKEDFVGRGDHVVVGPATPVTLKSEASSVALVCSAGIGG